MWEKKVCRPYWPAGPFGKRGMQDVGSELRAFFGYVLVRIAQRLDVNRGTIECRRDGLGQECAVVGRIVPGKAALIAGVLPKCGHVLDGLDRLLAVDRDG